MQPKTLLYHIRYHPIMGMGGMGFQVQLFPQWKEEIAKLNLTQKEIDYWLEETGKHLYKEHFPQYESIGGISDYNIMWGEWGPEHITVPGDACGIDKTDSIGIITLNPHNVDSFAQMSLLLTTFCHFADLIVTTMLYRQYQEKRNHNESN